MKILAKPLIYKTSDRSIICWLTNMSFLINGVICTTLNYSGKVPSVNYRLTNLQISGAKMSLQSLISDSSIKSSGDVFVDSPWQQPFSTFVSASVIVLWRIIVILVTILIPTLQFTCTSSSTSWIFLVSSLLLIYNFNHLTSNSNAFDISLLTPTLQLHH